MVSCGLCLLTHATSAQELPSFPTRRSSDLRGRTRPGGASARRPRRRLTPRGPRECPRGSPPGRGRAIRSEEHTSELQSHSDLVCRLLLEKKKPKGRHYFAPLLISGLDAAHP